jgi:hypothetical protein
LAAIATVTLSRDNQSTIESEKGNTALKCLLKLQRVTGKNTRHTVTGTLLVILQFENAVGFRDFNGRISRRRTTQHRANAIIAVPFAALVTSAVTIFSSSLTVK